MGKLGTAFFAAALWFAGGAAIAMESRPQATATSPELDRLVRDVCNKPVVLLGEDATHGGGRTLELKTRLVRRLIDECGFSALMFESPLYDFIDLSRALKSRTASSARLSDALGGLWSTAGEVDPLVSFLYQEALNGRIRLFGLGPSLGEATALYARKRMPAQLTRHLSAPRRSECEAELLRYTSWTYDDAHPYGPAVETRLKTCAREIQAAVASLTGPSANETQLMATNVVRHFEITADGSKDSWGQRDRAMADNFAWVRSRLPARARIIVWCATVHAAKRLPADSRQRQPMGSYIHRALGDKAWTIGFTALSGRIGPIGQPVLDLPAAPADSLEQLALVHSDVDLRYLDRTELHALGIVPARALDQTRMQSADWSTVVDGLIVLREERPVRRVRSAMPQQIE